MPITTSDNWKKHQYNVSAEEHIIVKLTDGTDTWLLGDIEMNLDDGHVFRAVSNIGTIKSGFNIFSRKWLTPDVSVRLTNHEYARKPHIHVLPNSLAHWDFTAESLLDMSGNGHTLTNNKAVPFLPGITEGGNTAADIASASSSADEMWIPNSTNADFQFGPTQSFSTDVIFKCSNTLAGKGAGGYVALTESTAVGAGNMIFGIAVAASADNKLGFRLDDGTNVVTGDYGSAVNDGKWHHAVLVVDRSIDKAFIYLDGSDITSGGVDISTVTGSTPNASLLTVWVGDQLDGQIDCASFLNRVMTAAEISHRSKRLPTANNFTSKWDRLGDVLEQIRNTEATIYYFKGPSITSLADCLKRFTGKIVQAPSYSKDSVSIRIMSKGMVVDRVLPQQLIEDIYPSAPAQTKSRLIPLVWGEFTNPGDLTNTFRTGGLGLAIAERIADGVRDNNGYYAQLADHNTFVVSNHPLLSLTRTYLKHDPTEVGLFRDPVLNINNAGRGTTSGGNIYFFVTSQGRGGKGYDIEALVPPDSVGRAGDHDDATEARCWNNLTSVSGNTLFNVDDITSFLVQYILADNKLRLTPQVRAEIAAGYVASSPIDQIIRLYHGNNGTSDQYKEMETTITKTVTASLGDARMDDTAELVATSTFARLGYNVTNGPRSIPLVFESLGIPQGAIIKSAIIKPYGLSTSASTNYVYGTMYCIDVDDVPLMTDGDRAAWDAQAKTFGTGTGNLVNRTGRFDLPDIKTRVQAVVNRAGWTSSSKLGVMIEGDNTSSDGYLEIDQYDNVPANACQIEIVYTVGITWNNTWQSPVGSPIALAQSDITLALCIGVEYKTTFGGPVDQRELLFVYETRLLAEVSMKPELQTKAFAMCKGRSFADWIYGAPTTITKTITASGGDALADETSMMLIYSGFSRVGYNVTNGPRSIPLVFESLGIPQGSTIHHAIIKPYVTANSNNNVHGTIYCIDVDDTPLMTDGGRTAWDAQAKTSGVVTGNIANQTVGARFDLPDIKTLVQAVVNRAGWTSSSKLGVMIEGDNTLSDGYVEIDQYDNVPANACQIEIMYTAAGSTELRTNTYNKDELIEEPVFIIESILRDELGLTNADIDIKSFDAASDISMKARLNLHEGNKMKAMDAVRMMAEQSKSAFTWGVDGLARIVRLDDKIPTTTRVIPYSHIVNGNIRVSRTRIVRNKLKIESGYMAEYDEFAETSVVEDTVSQAQFNEPGKNYGYAASWKAIAGATATAVGALLVNPTDGIWSKEHIVIEFETAGFIHSDLLEGDWIELDAASVDPHLLCYGASWSGLQFLLTGIEESGKKTKFTAIKLW